MDKLETIKNQESKRIVRIAELIKTAQSEEDLDKLLYVFQDSINRMRRQIRFGDDAVGHSFDELG